MLRGIQAHLKSAKSNLIKEKEKEEVRDCVTKTETREKLVKKVD